MARLNHATAQSCLRYGRLTQCAFSYLAHSATQNWFSKLALSLLCLPYLVSIFQKPNASNVGLCPGTFPMLDNKELHHFAF